VLKFGALMAINGSFAPAPTDSDGLRRALKRSVQKTSSFFIMSTLWQKLELLKTKGNAFFEKM
jgi:hypothetical protein